MNFNGKFNFLGTVDISELKKLILTLTEEDWNEVSWRQELYKVHSSTQTISLLFDTDFRHENPTQHKFYNKFEKALEPVLNLIKKTVVPHNNQFSISKQSSYPIRVNLVRLLPNGNISVHNDKNHSLTHSHRIHLPIITNNKVLFTVDNETINLQAGQLIEINNRVLHHVMNNSQKIRTHIIIDWVIPGERCCCGTRFYPEKLCTPENCHYFNFTPILCDCYKL